MKNIEKIVDFLKNYNGKELTIMEVCGSHTAAITKSGIKDIISPKIRFVSGPGCPVCVTISSYIDKLIELSKSENTEVVTFGDLMRVPGSFSSLQAEKGKGAKVQMVYSPMDTFKLAEINPDTNYIFAAVGFETTIPVYACMMDYILANNIKNVKLLTSLKVMPPAISWLMDNNANIDAFIAPGHVSVIIGSEAYVPLSEKYKVPFAVTGFKPEELCVGIAGLVKMCMDEKPAVKNYYPSVVLSEGNKMALDKIFKYFKYDKAVWRGLGAIDDSGLVLKEEYLEFDAGSTGLSEDIKINAGCSCDKVLMGKLTPNQCPLFKKVCNPQNPQGACMVSEEGSCFQSFLAG
ncbi:MAG: hydrogenase formation protein HypD [Lachnospiraceae bacterium]|nr:hydrogenase formation protein HypD [Lachnospiraceae bacterium]